MTKYYFETSTFGLSDQGIHLLRNRFNYETFEFSDIDTLMVYRGKELKNWLVILIIGVVFITSSIWYTLRLYSLIDNNEVNSIYIEELIVPIIPLMLGFYCLYASTKNGTMLNIKTIKNKTDKLPLKELEKSDMLNEFKDLLKEKLPPRVKVNF